jgi:FKBP-type peptidyl-prolyl cis-trans isomerase FklB
MTKKIFMPLVALCALFALVSCSEQEEVGEYDNWKERNVHYLDSIATLADSNLKGWSKIKSYTMGDSIGLDADRSYYIYVQKLETGHGTYNPQAKDSVRVHYSGRLIPTASYPLGYNFDKSYSGATLNEATDVPSLLGMTGIVYGFSTALMHMVEGDHWRVVIPSYLGYRDQSSTSVPAHSTLIFDLKLSKVYRYRIDTNTSWH